MTLPNDYSRCRGTLAPVCRTCARRLQMERDDPSLFFWMMPPAEIGGRCEYKIEDEHDNQD